MEITANSDTKTSITVNFALENFAAEILPSQHFDAQKFSSLLTEGNFVAIKFRRVEIS